jgi:hypothetical protein
MDLIYFGGSAAAGIVGWATIFATIIWPKMKRQPRVQQLKTLTAINFFRYFATTLLIAGLVSHKLPSGFADPAAFGDLISLVLAYIAFIGLQRSRAERPLLFPVWVFNIVGAADLLLAMVLGPALIHDPGDLGLGYIIPTVYVPLLLVAHFYSLKVLSQRTSEKSATVGKLPSPLATPVA